MHGPRWLGYLRASVCKIYIWHVIQRKMDGYFFYHLQLSTCSGWLQLATCARRLNFIIIVRKQKTPMVIERHGVEWPMYIEQWRWAKRLPSFVSCDKSSTQLDQVGVGNSDFGIPIKIVQDWSLQCPANMYFPHNNPSKRNPTLKLKDVIWSPQYIVIYRSQEPTSVGHCHYKK